MKRLVLVLSVLCFFLFACAKPRPQVDYFNYAVARQGETLAVIAKWYTGSSANWSVIQSHNPGLDPKRMKIGTVVRIPETMLVRRDPLPKKIAMQGADKAEEEKSKAAEVKPPAGPETQFVEKSENAPAAEAAPAAPPEAAPPVEAATSDNRRLVGCISGTHE